MTMLAIGSSRLEAFAQLITLFLIFAFVLALTYFATKWVGNYQKEKMSGSNITVLETMKISGTKYLQIIKIGTKCFAIAVCKDTITYLSNPKAFPGITATFSCSNKLAENSIESFIFCP